MCHLTTRQRRLYQAVRNKISIDDLVYTSTSSSSTNATTSSLMNLVMQFRKVSWFWHFLCLSLSVLFPPCPSSVEHGRTTSYTILLTRSLPGVMIKPCNVASVILAGKPRQLWKPVRSFIILQSGKGSTFFDENIRANFSVEKNFSEAFRWVYFLRNTQ